MLICDVCNNGYALYKQHEKVCDSFSYKTEGQKTIFRPQVCYQCARKIHDVTKRIFCSGIKEE